MGIYKKGHVWWMIKVYKGKKVEKSLDTKIKRKAEERFAKVVSEIVDGTYFQKPKDVTVKELIARYCQDRLKAKAINTIERDKTLKSHIENHFGNYKIADVTPEMVSGYRQKRYAEGKSIATVNRELAFLRNAYNVAIESYEWCFKNPVSKIKFDKENNERDKWLTPEQEERLLSNLSGRYRDIVKLVINTGLRLMELLTLNHSNVDLFRKVIIVKGKGEKVRTIPLNSIAVEVIKERLKTRHIRSELVFPSAEGTVIQKSRLRVAFKKALEKAGIEDFHFHDLRHTFATRLAQSGVDLLKICELLGHEDISTTQRYAHHCPDSLRSSVDALEKYYNFTTVNETATEGVKENVA
jgi:site-specific recombinase XerD